MTNGLSLEELMKEGTYPEEYAEGENWKILHGDTLKPVSYTHLRQARNSRRKYRR